MSTGGAPQNARANTSKAETSRDGLFSFDTSMHGHDSYGQPTANTTAFGSGWRTMSDYDYQRCEWMNQALTRKLGPEYISTRSQGGSKLCYVEGWKLFNVANEVFGFDGWSSSIVNLSVDYCDDVQSQGSTRYNIGASAIVRVTLRSGVYHEDVGYGQMQNSPQKGPAFEKVKKEAVTDAVKRALRQFGNLTGNCVYDKQFCNEITKHKVTPVKLDPSELHRHPLYDPNRSADMSTSSTSSRAPPPPAPRPNPPPQPQAPRASTSAPPPPAMNPTNPPAQQQRPSMPPPQPQQRPAPPAPQPQQRPVPPSRPAPAPATAPRSVQVPVKPAPAPAPLRRQISAVSDDGEGGVYDESMDEDTAAMMDQIEANYLADVGPPIMFDEDPNLSISTGADVSSGSITESQFQPVGHSTFVHDIDSANSSMSSGRSRKSTSPGLSGTSATERDAASKKRLAAISQAVGQQHQAPARSSGSEVSKEEAAASAARRLAAIQAAMGASPDPPAQAPSHMPTTSAPAPVPTARVNSPSFGGSFKFPAGMTVELSQNERFFSRNPNASAAGQKRSADGSFKSVQSSRQVLGDVQVDHDGGVKRPRY